MAAKRPTGGKLIELSGRLFRALVRKGLVVASRIVAV